MNRYRISTRTSTADGSETRLSSVLSSDEAEGQLDLEEILHIATGWTTARHGGSLVCISGGVVRTLSIQVRTPFTDMEMSC